MPAVTSEKAVSARLQAYAKRHNGGAFSAPLPADVATMDVHEGDGWVVVSKRLRVMSRRRDFTGRPITMPPGWHVAVALARDEGAEAPPLTAYDAAVTHLDDRVVTERCRADGLSRAGVQVSAAGELLGVWMPDGNERRYEPWDRVQVATAHLVPPEAVLADLAHLSGWHDDYPYYSDGSWAGLSLRGFDRDPSWGVKPAEMGRRWNADHPGAIERACVWTDLADVCSATVEWIGSIGWWGRLERVRYMRMAARSGGGRLARHSDITDRSAGTADGLVTRWHVPLQTHRDIKMTTWGLDGAARTTHLAPGWAWYLDQRMPHAVVNPSEVDRIHLVVDVLSDAEVRDRILIGAM